MEKTINISTYVSDGYLPNLVFDSETKKFIIPKKDKDFNLYKKETKKNIKKFMNVISSSFEQGMTYKDLLTVPENAIFLQFYAQSNGELNKFIQAGGFSKYSGKTLERAYRFISLDTTIIEDDLIAFANSDILQEFLIYSFEGREPKEQYDKVCFWIRRNIENEKNLAFLLKKGFETKISMGKEIDDRFIYELQRDLLVPLKKSPKTYDILRNIMTSEFSSYKKLFKFIKEILPLMQSEEDAFDYVSNDETFNADMLRFFNESKIKRLIGVYEKKLSWRSFEILGECLKHIPQKNRAAEIKRTMYEEKKKIYDSAIPPSRCSFWKFPSPDTARIKAWLSKKFPEDILNNEEIVRWFFGTVINEAKTSSGLLSLIKRNYNGILKQEILDAINDKLAERNNLWASRLSQIAEDIDRPLTEEQLSNIRFVFSHIEKFLFVFEDINNTWGGGIGWQDPYRNIGVSAHNFVEQMEKWCKFDDFSHCFKNIGFELENIIGRTTTIYKEMQEKAQKWKALSEKYPQVATALRNGILTWDTSEKFIKDIISFADGENRKSRHNTTEGISLYEELQLLINENDKSIIVEMLMKLMSEDMKFYSSIKSNGFREIIDTTKENVFGLPSKDGIKLLQSSTQEYQNNNFSNWTKNGDISVIDSNGRRRIISHINFSYNIRNEIRIDIGDMIEMAHYGLIDIFEELLNNGIGFQGKTGNICTNDLTDGQEIEVTEYYSNMQVGRPTNNEMMIE